MIYIYISYVMHVYIYITTKNVNAGYLKMGIDPPVMSTLHGENDDYPVDGIGYAICRQTLMVLTHAKTTERQI